MKLNNKIQLFKVRNTPGISKKIEKVFRSGEITEGKYSKDFEDKLCNYFQNNNCVLVNSATSALTLAYRLIGLKKNDEVLVTPLTCMATNQPLNNIGVKLKFVDIDKNTGNISLNDLKKKISAKTRAISFVHWAGNPVDLIELKNITKKYKIPIIEDAAHSFGATLRNKKIGTFKNFSIFSFQAIKHITTGDGGMLICPNSMIANRARKLRWFGLNRNFNGNKWKQDIKESGYKFHMNNISAVIGIEQLKNIDKILAIHRKNATYYNNFISNKKIQLLKFNKEASYWIFSLLVDNKKKFISYLNKNNISCDEVHIRNDKYSVFKKFYNPNLKNMNYFEKHMVNIPVGWWLTKKEIKQITTVINKY